MTNHGQQSIPPVPFPIRALLLIMVRMIWLVGTSVCTLPGDTPWKAAIRQEDTSQFRMLRYGVNHELLVPIQLESSVNPML